MKTDHTYDPEDIESLLMHKQFNELFEEERNFILQHVENEEEYESLRKTLYELHNVAFDEELLEPDPSVKAAIMREFATEKRGGFMVWLNSLFTFPEVTWHRQPAFRLALVGACVVGLSIFFIYHNESESAIAEVKSTPENSVTSPHDVADSNNLFAENLSTDEFPPAPKQLPVSNAAIPKTVNAEIVEVSESKRDELLSAEDAVDEVSAVKKLATVAEGSASSSKMNVLKDKSVESEADVSSTSPPAMEKLVSESLKEVTITESGRSNQWSNQAATISSQSVQVQDVESEYSWAPAPVVNSIAASDMKDLINLLYTAQ